MLSGLTGAQGTTEKPPGNLTNFDLFFLKHCWNKYLNKSCLGKMIYPEALYNLI